VALAMATAAGKGIPGSLDFCMEWNPESQLKRVTKNGVEQARFAYDPMGRFSGLANLSLALESSSSDCVTVYSCDVQTTLM
jgi:hypothetical protein